MHDDQHDHQDLLDGEPGDPGPDPSPDATAQGDESPPDPAAGAQHAEPEPEGKGHRLSRRPQNPKGVYMVIRARANGQPPIYHEVGFFRAHGPDAAKRQAVQDAEAGHLPELRNEIHDDHGVLLRAVPAASWPKVEATKLKEQAPKVVIG